MKWPSYPGVTVAMSNPQQQRIRRGNHIVLRTARLSRGNPLLVRGLTAGADNGRLFLPFLALRPRTPAPIQYTLSQKTGAKAADGFVTQRFAGE